MVEDTTVDRPSQAWLAPIMGVGVTIVLRVAIGHFFADMEQTRGTRLVQGLVPFSALLLCIGFGYFKSIQCLRGWRNTFHGFAGLLANTAMVGIIVLGFVALQVARTNARLLAQPENVVARLCASVQNELPARLDDNTTLRSVYPGPPLVVNLEYQIHGIARDSLTDAMMDDMEQNIRQSAAKENPFPELEGIGATIHYIYRHENGDVVLEFTIDL